MDEDQAHAKMCHVLMAECWLLQSLLGQRPRPEGCNPHGHGLDPTQSMQKVASWVERGAFDGLLPYLSRDLRHNLSHLACDTWVKDTLAYGDVLHVPASEMELNYVNSFARATGMFQQATNEDWKRMASKLPGRTPQDCYRMLQDFHHGNTELQRKQDPNILRYMGMAQDRVQLATVPSMASARAPASCQVPRRSLFHALQHRVLGNTTRKRQTLPVTQMLAQQYTRTTQIQQGSGSVTAIRFAQPRVMDSDADVEAAHAHVHDPSNVHAMMIGCIATHDAYNRPGELLHVDLAQGLGKTMDGHRRIDEHGQVLRASVNDMLVTHDQRTVFTASLSPDIQMWDADTATRLASLQGHTGPVHELSLHAQLPVLASCGADGKVLLWPFDNEERTVKPPRTVASRAMDSDGKNDVQSIAFLQCPWRDDLVGVTSLNRHGTGGIVHLWDYPSTREIKKIPLTTPLSLVAVCHQGPYIAVGCDNPNDIRSYPCAASDGILRLYDIRGPMAAPTFAISTGFLDMTFIKFSADDQLVALDDMHTNRIGIYDWRKPDQPLHLIHHSSSPVRFTPPEALWFHQHHHMLVTGGPDERLCFWDTRLATSNALLRSVSDHDGAITSLSLSNDEAYLAVGTAASTVHLYATAEAGARMSERLEASHGCVTFDHSMVPVMDNFPTSTQGPRLGGSRRSQRTNQSRASATSSGSNRAFGTRSRTVATHAGPSAASAHLDATAIGSSLPMTNCPDRYETMEKFKRAERAEDQIHLLLDLLDSNPLLARAVHPSPSDPRLSVRKVFTPGCRYYIEHVLQPILTCYQDHCRRDMELFKQRHGTRIIHTKFRARSRCPECLASLQSSSLSRQAVSLSSSMTHLDEAPRRRHTIGTSGGTAVTSSSAHADRFLDTISPHVDMDDSNDDEEMDSTPMYAKKNNCPDRYDTMEKFKQAERAEDQIQLLHELLDSNPLLSRAIRPDPNEPKLVVSRVFTKACYFFVEKVLQPIFTCYHDHCQRDISLFKQRHGTRIITSKFRNRSQCPACLALLRKPRQGTTIHRSVSSLSNSTVLEGLQDVDGLSDFDGAPRAREERTATTSSGPSCDMTETIASTPTSRNVHVARTKSPYVDVDYSDDDISDESDFDDRDYNLGLPSTSTCTTDHTTKYNCPDRYDTMEKFKQAKRVEEQIQLLLDLVDSNPILSRAVRPNPHVPKLVFARVFTQACRYFVEKVVQPIFTCYHDHCQRDMSLFKQRHGQRIILSNFRKRSQCHDCITWTPPAKKIAIQSIFPPADCPGRMDTMRRVNNSAATASEQINAYLDLLDQEPIIWRAVYRHPTLEPLTRLDLTPGCYTFLRQNLLPILRCYNDHCKGDISLFRQRHGQRICAWQFKKNGICTQCHVDPMVWSWFASEPIPRPVEENKGGGRVVENEASRADHQLKPSTGTNRPPFLSLFTQDSEDDDDDVSMGEYGNDGDDIDDCSDEYSSDAIAGSSAVPFSTLYASPEDCPERKQVMKNFRRSVDAAEQVKLLLDLIESNEGLATALLGHPGKKRKFTSSCQWFIYTVRPIVQCFREHCKENMSTFIARHGERIFTTNFRERSQCLACHASRRHVTTMPISETPSMEENHGLHSYEPPIKDIARRLSAMEFIRNKSSTATEQINCFLDLTETDDIAKRAIYAEAGNLRYKDVTPACYKFIVQYLRPVLRCYVDHCGSDIMKFIEKHGRRIEKVWAFTSNNKCEICNLVPSDDIWTAREQICRPSPFPALSNPPSSPPMEPITINIPSSPVE